MPDTLANKIAAGEVVERPASVVKELVENSIDANSSWIKIDIVEAGLKRIKVIDNGDGMSEDDCEKAFLRHATSKLRYEADLFHVQTLGFRGEALASIAAVSRLKIKSSQGDRAGAVLTIEGGKLIGKTKSDARKGTEIVVEDLFFNTPARLKYMKSLHTELGHITDLLNRLALSHPGIRFEATHNGKPLFKTSGTGDMLQVIAQVYGTSVARKMLPIENETLDFSLKGYVGKPEITRASRNYISTIINGRFIKSHPLSQAIIKAYHTLLPIGRFPIAVIAIQMDPVLVDVNVHPTKLQVRFSKERELFTLVEDTIRSRFRQSTLIPEIEHKDKPKEQAFQQTLDLNAAYPQADNTRTEASNGQRIFEQKTLMTQQKKDSRKNDSELYLDKGIDGPKNPPVSDVYQNNEQPTDERIPTMHPIGQLHGTYILAQNETGLFIIDQHAAQERIKYEFYKRKLGKPTNHLQELLLPLTFEFSRQESLFIEQYKERLQQVGLFFEPFGEQTYIIRSYPAWFPKGFAEEVIREMVEQIVQTEQVDIEAIREDVAILMACKRSIKANHYLNREDMLHLLEDLRQTTDPFTCPHGRPIMIHFSSYELEKMFKRVM